MCSSRLRKTVRIKTGPQRDVTLWRNCQQIRLMEYCTLYGGMWNLFCRAGHDSCVQDLFWSIRRSNLPCNAEDNLLAGLIVIEAWFMGY